LIGALGAAHAAREKFDVRLHAAYMVDGMVRYLGARQVAR
jgi:hypothetical protein